MRFIFNFFFFGILFYLIYLFFPEAFHTLVGFADKAYVFLKDLVVDLYGRVHPSSITSPAPSVPAAFLLPLMWQSFTK